MWIYVGAPCIKSDFQCLCSTQITKSRSQERNEAWKLGTPSRKKDPINIYCAVFRFPLKKHPTVKNEWRIYRGTTHALIVAATKYDKDLQTEILLTAIYLGNIIREYLEWVLVETFWFKQPHKILVSCFMVIVSVKMK